MSEQQSLTNEGLITAKRYLDWYLRHPEVLPPDAAWILGITRQHAWRVRRQAIEALSHKKGPGAARRKQEVLDEFEPKSLKELAPEAGDSVGSVLLRVKPRVSDSTYLMLSFILSSPKPVHLREIVEHTGSPYQTIAAACTYYTRRGFLAPMGRGVYWKPEVMQPQHLSKRGLQS